MGRKSDEPGRWWGWLKGCGCALVLIGGAAILVVIVVAVAMVHPYHEAVELREALEARHGTQAGFTPPPDGAVPAERMEVFLAVRERLSEACARLTESRAAIQRVESFDGTEDLPEDPSLIALFEGGVAALGLEQRRGELFRARNQALLDAGMGQGEYTYIFAVSYSARLASWREEDGRVAVEELKVFSRVRRLLREMLQRQLAAVEAGPPGPERDTWAEELAAEIARLEEDARRIPWMEGLPERIEASVAPHRERLDAHWCEAAAHLELLRNEIDGIAFHSH